MQRERRGRMLVAALGVAVTAVAVWSASPPNPGAQVMIPAAPTPDPTPSTLELERSQDTEISAADLPCAAQLPASQHRGMCYAHNWQYAGRRGYGSATSRASLEELAALGVDWISVTPFGYQPGLDSTEVHRITTPAGETDARMREVVENAHALGIKVMMKPHIWISYSAWRGDIDPGSADGWDAWFESYRDFIQHYAELSEALGADMLVIGVEFRSSTQTQEAHWRALIEDVRAAYSGPLTYAANWDEVEHVAFWDALDYIGVQMFAPLATTYAPTLEELREVSRRYLDHYTAISTRLDRPLILTEVGYKSIEGTAQSPWAWPEHLPAGFDEPDYQAQANAYCAILETFGQSEHVAGMYWWKWFTDPDTDEEGPIGFSPRSKPAEDLLRYAFSP